MSILAAVDRSDRSTYVVREAAKLARAFDTEIHVLHVLSTSEFVGLERTTVETENEALEVDEVRELAAEIADEAASDLDQPYTAVGLVGDASSEIRRYATEQDADYIVLSPRKRSPTGKAIFGSVAQSVIINASQPVVTARE
ncbi:universal stress protein [Natronorubrum sp. FCH18a]|uniref:universal stress protein n=1 Tax=Natronorubrum sp. FCH18a TaxID=3447018 RepID=UPI003F515EFC